MSARPFCALLCCLLLSPLAWAGGPLVVNSAGERLVWSNGQVRYSFDPGPLGSLSSTDARRLVLTAFRPWGGVPGASVEFVFEGMLEPDVTADNVLSLFANCNDGITPIIFDRDGAIVSALFGIGAENMVLGFSGPECGSFLSPVLGQGVMILN